MTRCQGSLWTPPENPTRVAFCVIRGEYVWALLHTAYYIHTEFNSLVYQALYFQILVPRVICSTSLVFVAHFKPFGMQKLVKSGGPRTPITSWSTWRCIERYGANPAKQYMIPCKIIVTGIGFLLFIEQTLQVVTRYNGITGENWYFHLQRTVQLLYHYSTTRGSLYCTSWPSSPKKTSRQIPVPLTGT